MSVNLPSVCRDLSLSRAQRARNRLSVSRLSISLYLSLSLSHVVTLDAHEPAVVGVIRQGIVWGLRFGV